MENLIGRTFEDLQWSRRPCAFGYLLPRWLVGADVVEGLHSEAMASLHRRVRADLARPQRLGLVRDLLAVRLPGFDHVGRLHREALVSILGRVLLHFERAPKPCA